MDSLTHRFKYGFNIESEYLVIIGKCYSVYSNKYLGDDKIYLHKEDILWVINTIRSFKKELYNRGSDRLSLRHSENDFISFIIDNSFLDFSLKKSSIL